MTTTKSRRRRSAWHQVAAGFVLLLVTTLVMGVVAPASASERGRLKEIKRSLVDIEERLDASRAEIGTIGPALWAATSDLRRRHRNVDRRLAASTFVSTMQLLPQVVEVVEAGARKAELEARGEELQAEASELEEARTREIDALSEIAERRLARRVAAEWSSERARRRVALWANAAAWSGTLPAISGVASYSADWDAIAMCESSGRWHIDARYDGGLQFDPITWIEFGGGQFARFAHQAGKAQQIAIAERVLAVQGPKAWPNCFRAKAAF